MAELFAGGGTRDGFSFGQVAFKNPAQHPGSDAQNIVGNIAVNRVKGYRLWVGFNSIG